MTPRTLIWLLLGAAAWGVTVGLTVARPSVAAVLLLTVASWASAMALTCSVRDLRRTSAGPRSPSR